jgi:gluconolactonase
LINGRVFYNATESLTSKEEEFGKPDGLKVDIYGNIFATGPGGVVVFNSKGEMIGRLRLDRPAANIWIGSNNYLYIAASELVIRLRINTKPTRFLAKI